jgi:hypothetical protein
VPGAQAYTIDPRDEQWAKDHPSYRVYFWRKIAPGPDGAWGSDEWQIEDAADVHEVIAWAEEHAEGRTYVLYAVVDDPDGPGLVRLAGTDPTNPLA